VSAAAMTPAEIRELCSALNPRYRAEVQAAAEEFFKDRPAPDLELVMQVLLREQWRFLHGSYDEWDRAAAAQGVVIR